MPAETVAGVTVFGSVIALRVGRFLRRGGPDLRTWSPAAVGDNCDLKIL
jgi:hypothetical protein